MRWKSLLTLVAGAGLMMTALGCGGGDDTADRSRQRERENQLAHQVAAMQQQVAALEQEVVTLRAEQDQRINTLLQASQGLTNQLQQMRATLLPGAPAVVLPEPPAAAPRPAGAAGALKPVEDEGGGWGWFARAVIGVVILGAIFLIVKVTMGRIQDGYDEDDELDSEEQPFQEDAVTTELGSIRVAPEVQRELDRQAAAARAEAPAADVADSDGEDEPPAAPEDEPGDGPRIQS